MHSWCVSEHHLGRCNTVLPRQVLMSSLRKAGMTSVFATVSVFVSYALRPVRNVCI